VRREEAIVARHHFVIEQRPDAVFVVVAGVHDLAVQERRHGRDGLADRVGDGDRSVDGRGIVTVHLEPVNPKPVVATFELLDEGMGLAAMRTARGPHEIEIYGDIVGFDGMPTRFLVRGFGGEGEADVRQADRGDDGRHEQDPGPGGAARWGHKLSPQRPACSRLGVEDHGHKERCPSDRRQFPDQAHHLGGAAPRQRRRPRMSSQEAAPS
jgi:hypothetical protein